MIITATNNKDYTVRHADGQDLEIESGDIVYVFEDLSIGNFSSGKKEAVFYKYRITESGEREFIGRHNIIDFASEFATFLQSDAWKEIQANLIISLLRKVEFTEIPK